MSTAARLPGTASTVLYVFGVVAAEDATGLEAALEDRVGHRSSLVRSGRVAAIALDVPREEFSQDALPARLEDLAWLEENVRRHEGVLESVLGLAPVVPFRFCTLYTEREELLEFLDAHAADLEAALERVRGKAEQGVKAFLDRARLESTLRAESEEGPDAEIVPASAGRAYLLRRRREQGLAREADGLTAELAAECHGRLAGAADDAVLLDPQPPELSGRPERMVLNGAYLVASEREGAFADALAELADRFRDVGLSFARSGPWPAYNFVPREVRAR
jgi:hypothetical protein